MFEQRVKYWKDRIGNILLNPFNKDNWFKYQQVEAENLKQKQDAKLEAEKAEKMKKLKQNQLIMANQDAKIAKLSETVAKKRSELLNTETNIIS